MKQVLIRFLNVVIGQMLYALGIMISIKANIGYTPWDVFHAGLANVTGISFGVALMITGFVAVLTVTLLGEKVGLGTIAGMTLIGLFLDMLLKSNFVPLAENFLVGLGMMLLGLFIISLGSYVYIRAAMGTGPRDNLMVVVARRAKLPIGICRIIVEISATLAGWAMGGLVGLGTVISIFGVGFFIQLTFRMFKFDATAVKHESLYATYLNLRGKKPADKAGTEEEGEKEPAAVEE